jgi:hypothetical protein
MKVHYLESKAVIKIDRRDLLHCFTGSDEVKDIGLSVNVQCFDFIPSYKRLLEAMMSSYFSPYDWAI